ncbi:nucleotide exchange factor GrpE, partial [Rickettsiales bacterium]|nr:nucleotide exchange factor GrpE [Rickettsiales bacterium]
EKDSQDAENNIINNSESKKTSEENVKEVNEIDEIGILNKKIADLELVVSEQNNKILRSLADIENLRKRSQQEVEKASKFAISKFASELVMVVENFYLAIDNMPKDELDKSNNLKNFATGVNMTKNELVKILENNGIKRINPEGEKFDHNYHEAIAQAQGDESNSGNVKKVIQAGYSFHERLIRPALVEVFK